MNPLDDDVAFQRRKAHEERRAVIEHALCSSGMTKENAQIYSAEYIVGVLHQAVDMTFDPPKPYFGWGRTRAREGWWWRGLMSARREIIRLEQVENQKIDRLIRARNQEDKTP